jgi:hypothetical protein
MDAGGGGASAFAMQPGVSDGDDVTPLAGAAPETPMGDLRRRAAVAVLAF